MSNTIGKNIKVTLEGTSHGPFIKVTIKGFKKGTKIDFDLINENLRKRRGLLEISTSRQERDKYSYEGIENGIIVSDSISFVIPNIDVDDKAYSYLKNVVRPSHADLYAREKYNDFDYRGGGQFSGRLTVGLVIAGTIASSILKEKYGIRIASRIKQIHSVIDEQELSINDIDKLNQMSIPLVDETKTEDFKNEIIKARGNLDSVGGIVETIVDINNNLIGDPLFNSVESELSRYLFSIGGIKGVSFGLGFAFASKYGSEVNDSYYYEDEQIKLRTNNNGGIIGGLAKYAPINFKVVFKPTPSIGKIQDTINIKTKENVKLEIKGRHDPCIAVKGLFVVNAMTALSILDLLEEE